MKTQFLIGRDSESSEQIVKAYSPGFKKLIFKYQVSGEDTPRIVGIDFNNLLTFKYIQRPRPFQWSSPKLVSENDKIALSPSTVNALSNRIYLSLTNYKDGRQYWNIPSSRGTVETYPSYFYTAEGQTETPEPADDIVWQNFHETSEMLPWLIKNGRLNVHHEAVRFDKNDDSLKWILQHFSSVNSAASLDHSNLVHRRFIELHESITRHWIKLLGLAWRMLNRLENPPEHLGKVDTVSGTTKYTGIPNPSEPKFIALHLSANASGNGDVVIKGKNNLDAAQTQTIYVANALQNIITLKRFKEIDSIEIPTTLLTEDFRITAFESIEQTYDVPSLFYHEDRATGIIDETVEISMETGHGVAEFIDCLPEEYQYLRDRYNHNIFPEEHRNFIRDRFIKHVENEIPWKPQNRDMSLRFTDHDNDQYHNHIYTARNVNDWNDLFAQAMNALHYRPEE